MYKVLLIEDHEIARKQLTKFIHKEGFEVLQAENGRVGLELFHSGHPHIVITDMKMPDIDGMEVIHTIKRLSPNTDIILFTAFGETDIAITALREGVLDYLKKPIDLGCLSAALDRAKERIAMRQEQFLQPLILLAEDEDLPRKRLARVLEKENWTVIEAPDGEEAVRLFGIAKVDIVLTDINMPKLSGLQALHQMRAINIDFEAIIFTGYGDEQSAIQAMREGAISLLKKPVDLDQLIVVIEKALGDLQLVRALKYRNREFEIARQITTNITAEHEVIINLSKSVVTQTADFARRLLDSIPMSILVMKRDFTIVYVNKSLSSIIGGISERLDEAVLEEIRKLGIKEISLQQLAKIVNNLYDNPGGIETIKASESTDIIITLVTIKMEASDTYVLMAISGERPDFKDKA
ncbi:MAG: response regulator [Nitrospirae bacterium]|nr:response regulator [Nitrospirota bacterium]MBF0592503.1 response regulator [Nitrospirota bacterium]